jgi:hypothetical protein
MQEWTLVSFDSNAQNFYSISLDFFADEGWEAKYIWDILLEMSSVCLYFVLFNIVYKCSDTEKF